MKRLASIDTVVLLSILRVQHFFKLQVAKLSTKKAAEEELLADAPDEFLCPIMSILMTEPVILPSSKQVLFVVQSNAATL